MENPIIEMPSNYPFGVSQPSAEQQPFILVHKELPYDSLQEKQIIEQMIHFIKTLSHPNLINLNSVSGGTDSFHLYYEYVPFKLESWVLGVNEEMAIQLQDQLMELVDFLTRSSITFEFDPESVGLTSDMTAKYFLKEFSVDMQNQSNNCQKLQLAVKQYFSGLKKEVKPQSLKNSQHSGTGSQTPKEQPCSNQPKETRSTADSFSHLQELKEFQHDYKSFCNIKHSQPSSGKPNPASIHEKIQNSKQKSMQVLLRLKSFNRKQP